MEKLLNSVKDHSIYEIVLDSVKYLMEKILARKALLCKLAIEITGKAFVTLVYRTLL